MDLKKGLAVLGLFSIVGCFGEDAESPGPSQDVVLTDQVSAVLTSVSNTFIQMAFNVDSVIVNSDTVAAIDSVLDDDDDESSEEEEFNRDEFEAEVRQGVRYFLGNPQIGSDSITYTPDSRFCTELVAENSPEACLAAVANVRLVLIPGSNGEGRIEVYYEELRPVDVVYGPLFIQVNPRFSELNTTLQRVSVLIESIDGPEEDKPKFPDSVTGAGLIRLDRTGGATTEMSVQVSEDVRIERLARDEDDRDAYLIEIDPSPEFANATIDEQAQTAVLGLNLPTAYAKFTVNQDEGSRDIEIQAEGGEAVVSLNNVTRVLSLDRLNLNGPITAHADGEEFFRASQFSGIPMSLSLTAELNSHVNLTFSSEVDFELKFHPFIDEIGVDATLQVEANEGSVIRINKDAPSELVEGSVTLEGGLDWEGGMNLSDQACFELNLDLDTARFPVNIPDECT